MLLRDHLEIYLQILLCYQFITKVLILVLVLPAATEPAANPQNPEAGLVSPTLINNCVESRQA